MVPIWYASLTEVEKAADIPSSAFYRAKLSDVMDEATDAVKGLCGRSFEPSLETRWFAWPQDITQDPRMLRLGKSQMISLASVVDANGTIDFATVRLAKEGKEDDGPPYNMLWSNNGFNTNGDNPLRSVGNTGVYGYKIDERAVTTTVTNLANTTVDINRSNRIGVGSLIRIGDERLVVTDKGWLNSGNLVAINLDAEEYTDRFSVTSGAAYAVGEELLIESEQMLITNIVSNQLIVKRAINGTAIAAHSAVTVLNVDRRLTVERAVLGSTATDTALGASVYLFLFPSLVRQLCRAEALTIIQQDAASYGSRASANQGEMSMSIKGIENLRTRCKEHHGYGQVRGAAV